MSYFLQHFAKNWVKTLLHGTLHKKWLISRRSTRFGGFSPNAILFATFCKKLGQNPTAWYFFAQKVAYFEEIDKFWWFFTKCHTFCNILLKIGQNPSARYFAQKVAYFEEIDKFWWFFTKCHTFCTFCKKLRQNPSARYFAQKVAYFEEIDTFWWFFTTCHTFSDIIS